MTWVLAGALAAVVFFVTALVVRGGGPTVTCPSCHVPWIVLQHTGEHGRAYQVLACPSCTNVLTQVHGADSRAAYCPACTHRSLELRVQRGHGPALRAEVHESCGLCGHEASHHVGEPPDARPMGRVLPFRRPEAPPHARRSER